MLMFLNCRKQRRRSLRERTHSNKETFVRGANDDITRSLFAALILVCLASTDTVRAQDTIHVETTTGTRRVTGNIINYTGELLTVQRSSGREEKIASSRVESIDGAWKDSHRAANELFASGDFQEATAKYREALREEDRRWVQRRVLAQLTWCYRYVGDIANATKAFVALYSDDPTTPYFASIPLTWTTTRPDDALERQAISLLKNQDSAAARLIGASWLLSSSRRGEAIQVLRKFVSDADARIVFMAEAQLWRTQVVTSTSETLDQWHARIGKMPEPIRAGPHYILGLAQSRQAKHDEAALSFMRSVILYTEQRDLTPAALLAAARELETINQTTEASVLYREILTQHQDSSAAIEANSRLQQLTQ